MPEMARTYAFAQSHVAIGRAETNDVRLLNRTRTVSRLHAEIRLQEGGYYLVDLGSKNATFLNDRVLEADRCYPLRSGDTVRIANFELVFASMPEHPSSEGAADGGDALLQPLHAMLTLAQGAAERIEALQLQVQGLPRLLRRRRITALLTALADLQQQIEQIDASGRCVVSQVLAGPHNYTPQPPPKVQGTSRVDYSA